MLGGKKTVVTGGAGFIGSALVRQLAAAGAIVTVVDNLVNGKKENIEDVLGNHVVLEVADIRDRDRMADLVSGADIVYHLACLGVRHSLHDPLENHDVNATASLTVLQSAKDAGVERFVYVSTSEVYGTASSVPMHEEHPTFPMTVYGASKLAGECYSRAFYVSYGYPVIIVRPFNAFGPHCHHEGDSGEVIPKFMLRSMAGKPLVVFGDGAQTRDFTYVDDTARGIMLAGVKDAAIGRTLNLGSGREIAVNDLARMVMDTVGGSQSEIVHDDPRPGDVLRLYAEAGLARELLGFEAQVSLEDGLARLRDWYLSKGRSIDDMLAEEITHNWRAAEADGE
jgi:UDP-glucose 4-epimerase